MSFAIRVENLGKSYQLGATHAGSVRELVNRAWSRLRGQADASAAGPQTPHDAGDRLEGNTFWALRDVSFEVKPGEVVGIIGRNGSGKSTLLKILSQITAPTTGRIELRGRVASLLEVGTGFHPELSGRENIYLNGAILGMTKSEITRKFDEIVTFAEIEKFIDTPVKRYSSGMYVRLAFAVAAHLEPEILVVDEVLAVGDGAFQQKCIGKMGEVAKQGRTILFVSHNLAAVRSLCSRAVLLQSGKVASVGTATGVGELYIAETNNGTVGIDRSWENPHTAPGNDVIQLARVRLLPRAECANEILRTDTEFQIEVCFWNRQSGERIIINFEIYTADGLEVLETMSTENSTWRGRSYPNGFFRCRCRVPANLLNAGTYRLRVAFINYDARVLFDFPQALYFCIHDLGLRDLAFFGNWKGVVHPLLAWQVENLNHTRLPD